MISSGVEVLILCDGFLMFVFLRGGLRGLINVI